MSKEYQWNNWKRSKQFLNEQVWRQGFSRHFWQAKRSRGVFNPYPANLLHRSTIHSIKVSLGKGDLYSRSRGLLRRWKFPLSCKHTRIYAFHSQEDIHSCSSCFSTTALYLWPWLPSRQVLILICPKPLFSPILHQHSSSSFDIIHPSKSTSYFLSSSFSFTFQ